MCTTLRLDDKNDNLINQCVAPPLYPGTGTKIYVVWGERGNPAGNSSHNRAIKCNYFDWSNLTVGTVQTVEAYNSGIDEGDALGGCVLNNGTMLVGYGAANPRVKESTDGVNWINSADPTGTFGSGTGAVPLIIGMFTDGTTAFMLTTQTAGGGSLYDLSIYKRTGPGTWSFVSKIFDGPGSSNPPFYPNLITGKSGSRPGAMKDANTGFVVLDYQAVAGQTAMTRCLYTTNGWTTASEVTVMDHSPNSFARIPVVAPGLNGRAHVMWIDNATGLELPELAYTDDWGAHWTVVGKPSIFADTPWDNQFDRALAVSQATGKLFLSAFNTTDGTNERHFLFSGDNALSGWTERVCQHLTVIRGTGSCGAAILAGSGWFRLFNKSNTGPPDYFSIDLLWEPGVEILPPPPVCIVQPLAQYIIGGSGSVTMCGPFSTAGHTYTWAWTGPGGFTAATRCVTVSVPGTYSLTVTDEFSQQSFCQGIVVSIAAQPTPTAAGASIPYRRGDLHTLPGGHPAGNLTIATPGGPSA